ncbi:MAG: TrkA family potassium uptake protein [Verrucomicrobiales bacterium]
MKFAIIGLGYFGSSLARELADSGHEVLAIDTDEMHIREIRDAVAMAAQADGTDFDALTQLGVAGMDTAVVAIGEGFEASLMITAHCQKLGVPRIYTRVINEVHEHILGLMQITGKIRAESLAAGYFSRQLTNDAVRRYFGIDADHGIVELEMPGSFDGQTLADANLRQRFRLNVVTVRRPDNADTNFTSGDSAYSVLGTPEPSLKLQKHDHLIVFGKLKDIDRFCEEK